MKKEYRCERCGGKFKVMCPKARMLQIRVATEVGYKTIKDPRLCKNCLGSLKHFLERWWTFQK